MATTPYIQLIIGGNTLYFRDTQPVWRLEKDIIQFILPKKTDARDIMRVTETITLHGFWHDDTGKKNDMGDTGDGKTSIARMQIVRAASKTTRKSYTLLWNGELFKVWFKTGKFDKIAGQGDAIEYTIEMVVVDK